MSIYELPQGKEKVVKPITRPDGSTWIQWEASWHLGARAIEGITDKQRLFQELTQHIPFTHQIDIEGPDERWKVYTSLAPGYNLVTSSELYTGGDNREFYENLPFTSLFRGFITYVRLINCINENCYYLKDHKPDSVYIDPNKGISVVDTTLLTKVENKEIARKTEVASDSVDDLKLVLKSFFTRNGSVAEDFLIPPFLLSLIDKLSPGYDLNDLYSEIELLLSPGIDPCSFEDVDVGLREIETKAKELGIPLGSDWPPAYLYENGYIAISNIIMEILKNIGDSFDGKDIFLRANMFASELVVAELKQRKRIQNSKMYS